MLCAWCTPTEQLGEGSHGICPKCETRLDAERQARKERKQRDQLLHSRTPGKGFSCVLYVHDVPSCT